MSHDIAVFPSPTLLIRGKFPAKVKAGKSHSRYCAPKASWGQEAAWRGETLRTSMKEKLTCELKPFQTEENSRGKDILSGKFSLSAPSLWHTGLSPCWICSVRIQASLALLLVGLHVSWYMNLRNSPCYLSLVLKKMLKKAWQLIFLLP